jgi:hypothetical protein
MYKLQTTSHAANTTHLNKNNQGIGTKDESTTAANNHVSAQTDAGKMSDIKVGFFFFSFFLFFVLLILYFFCVCVCVFKQ